MTDVSGDSLEIAVRAIHAEPGAGAYQAIRVETDRGDIALRYRPARDAGTAVICLGGAAGGWDSPGAGKLYPQLCQELPERGVGVLRVRYRQPASLEESVLDVLAGAHFLATRGVERLALVGHALGGAVAAQAAANLENVRALVTLATQAQGLEALASVPEECACLFIHGEDDAVLPPSCSRYGYDLAPEPRYLRIFGGAGHDLDEVAESLRRELREWLLAELAEAAPL